MDVEDLCIDEEIKVKIEKLRGYRSKAEAYRIVACCWIDRENDKFRKMVNAGLRNEDYPLENKEKIKRRMIHEYKEELAKDPEYKDYFCKGFEPGQEDPKDLEGQVL